MLFVIGWKLLEAVALAVTPGVVSRTYVVVVRGREPSLGVFGHQEANRALSVWPGTP